VRVVRVGHRENDDISSFRASTFSGATHLLADPGGGSIARSVVRETYDDGIPALRPSPRQVLIPARLTSENRNC